MAVTLWGGPITVASDVTAAFLHELLPRRSEKVHVTSDHALHPRPGIRVRRCRLLPADVALVGPIPCTSVPRTLADLCHTSDKRDSVKFSARGGRLKSLVKGPFRSTYPINNG